MSPSSSPNYVWSASNKWWAKKFDIEVQILQGLGTIIFWFALSLPC